MLIIGLLLASHLILLSVVLLLLLAFGLLLLVLQVNQLLLILRNDCLLLINLLLQRPGDLQHIVIMLSYVLLDTLNVLLTSIKHTLNN